MSKNSILLPYFFPTLIIFFRDNHNELFLSVLFVAISLLPGIVFPNWRWYDSVWRHFLSWLAVLLLASNRQKPGMLLSILQGTGQLSSSHPTHPNNNSLVQSVLRLRNPDSTNCDICSACSINIGCASFSC